MLFAPAGTPAPIVQRLIREVIAAIATPEVTARYAELGITAPAMTPEAVADFVAVETRR